MKTEVYIAERKQAELALLESEQRYRRLLESVTDYVYTVTVRHGRSVATVHGPGCEAVTGYSPREFASDPSLWYAMIHEAHRAEVLVQVARILEGELPPPLEHRIVHKDGSIRWLRNTAVPYKDKQGRVIAYDGLVSDITTRKQAEELLTVQHGVTMELAEARTLHEALSRTLRRICETYRWDLAAFWQLDAPTGGLRWGEIWQAPCLDVEAFAAATRAFSVKSGVGLAGRVWASGQAAWVSDLARDAGCPRAPLARKVGLHGACAFPIRQGADVVGIIELVSREVRQPDEHMMRMLAAVGAQIGQVLERIRTEDALATERNLLRTLIDHLPDYIYAKDSQGRFTMSNPAHLRVLGVARPQDVLGKTDQDFFPSELARQYEADEVKVLQEGLPLINREEPVVDAEGRRQWVLTTKVPLQDGQSRITGLVGVTRNVTELKRAEEKHRMSEARLQAILDNSRAVIYLKDVSGRYLLINHRFEELFHVLRDEAVGKTDFDLFPETMARAFRENDQKVLAALAPLEFEEAAPHNGQPHIYLSGKFPLLDAAGRADAICGISTDITERKQAEEQLRRAFAELATSDGNLKKALRELEASHEELKTMQMQLIQAAKLESIGTLAAGVAHEVKNPLQTMLMGLHYLTRNLPAGNESVALAVSDMRDAVTRANAIIGELLQLSAATEFQLKGGDLNAVIEHSLRLLNTELLASRIQVARVLAAELPPVPMDPAKLEQVFVNLFLNALHAMPGGGRLTVGTRAVAVSPDLAGQDSIFRAFKPGTTVAVVEVCDTGTGIPEDCLPKIFDPFFTTKPVGAGTGLGLAVVKKIVDLHGGGIAIRNAPTGGAMVTLVLNVNSK